MVNKPRHGGGAHSCNPAFGKQAEGPKVGSQPGLHEFQVHLGLYRETLLQKQNNIKK